MVISSGLGSASGPIGSAQAQVWIFDPEGCEGNTYQEAAALASVKLQVGFFPDARTALTALSDFRRVPPKVFAFDWNAEGIHGERLMRWIKSQPHLLNMKVIVVAREHARKALTGAHRSGADRFVCAEPSVQAFEEKMSEAFKDCLR